MLNLIVGLFVLCVIYAYEALSWGAVWYYFSLWFIFPVLHEYDVMLGWDRLAFDVSIALAISSTLVKGVNVNMVDDKYLDKSKIVWSFIMPWMILLLGSIAHLMLTAVKAIIN